MHFPWFRKIGILFIPKSVFGLIIVLGGIGYLILSFVTIDSKSHSASDTLMNFAFVVCIVTIIYTLLGYLTSRSGPERR